MLILNPTTSPNGPLKSIPWSVDLEVLLYMYFYTPYLPSGWLAVRAAGPPAEGSHHGCGVGIQTLLTEPRHRVQHSLPDDVTSAPVRGDRAAPLRRRRRAPAVSPAEVT